MKMNEISLEMKKTFDQPLQQIRFARVEESWEMFHWLFQTRFSVSSTVKFFANKKIFIINNSIDNNPKELQETVEPWLPNFKKLKNISSKLKNSAFKIELW